MSSVGRVSVSNLCNPASQFVHESARGQLLFDDDTCLRIEEYSGAVSINDQPGVLTLQASDDSRIAIALSAAEDLIAKELYNSESESNGGLMVYIIRE